MAKTCKALHALARKHVQKIKNTKTWQELKKRKKLFTSMIICVLT